MMKQFNNNGQDIVNVNQNQKPITSRIEDNAVLNIGNI